MLRLSKRAIYRSTLWIGFLKKLTLFLERVTPFLKKLTNILKRLTRFLKLFPFYVYSPELYSGILHLSSLNCSSPHERPLN